MPDPKNKGTFIPNLKLQGSLTIFDAVGNALVLKQKLAWWERQKSLIYVWNLKNRNGRLVGSSTYRCVFEIEDITKSLDYQDDPQKTI